MTRPQAPRIPISRWRGRAWEHVDDAVAAEEPLQLLLNGEPLSIVMRTPGHDIELALGLLSAEHVIGSLAEVTGVRISAESGEREDRVPVTDDIVESNQIDVRVRDGAGRRPERSFLSSSACGVCGATTVESLAHDHAPLAGGPRVEAAMLPPLAQQLRGGQRVFDATGGLHAAGRLGSVLGSFARHVKWFAAPSLHPTDYSLLLTLPVIAAFGIAAIATAVAAFVQRRVPEPRIFRALERFAWLGPLVLGVHLGIALIVAAILGMLFVPSLRVEPDAFGFALLVAEAACGVLLLLGFATRGAALALAMLGVVAMAPFSFESILEQVHILV